MLTLTRSCASGSLLPLLARGIVHTSQALQAGRQRRKTVLVPRYRPFLIRLMFCPGANHVAVTSEQGLQRIRPSLHFSRHNLHHLLCCPRGITKRCRTDLCATLFAAGQSSIPTYTYLAPGKLYTSGGVHRVVCCKRVVSLLGVPHSHCPININPHALYCCNWGMSWDAPCCCAFHGHPVLPCLFADHTM